MNDADHDADIVDDAMTIKNVIESRDGTASEEACLTLSIWMRRKINDAVNRQKMRTVNEINRILGETR